MSGPEVCRRLKVDPRMREVVVIFMTAVPPELVREQLGACDYEGFIRKPFDLEEVLETVDRLLDA